MHKNDPPFIDSDLFGQSCSDGTATVAASHAVRPRSASLTANGDAVPYRSLVRPPVARLTIYDDGSRSVGEVVRLRGARTTLGRGQADVCLPNDPDLSARHATILRRDENGAHTWQLLDSDSTNGTFVRVSQCMLRGGQEVLLGGRRYQFVCQETIPSEKSLQDEEVDQVVTRCQVAPTAAQLARMMPQLLEQRSDQADVPHAVKETGVLIGRDPFRCGVCIADPFLDSVHAECFQDAQCRWIMRDRASLNGIWIRVRRWHLHPGTEFQLGGQRFQFDIA